MLVLVARSRHGCLDSLFVEGQVNSDQRVTTVVVSRNRRAEVLQTIAYHEGPVILVDNGSDDSTADAVERRFPHVRVVRLAANLGAPARNIGAQLAMTPYVAFADDDSWWAPGALSDAAAVLDEHRNLGLLAGRILLGHDNVEDPLCRLMADSPLTSATDNPGKPILGFAACAAVVRRDAFLAVGGFDPVVFFGGEEARVALDFAAAGWQLRYAPHLLVHHHPSKNRLSRPLIRARTIRSALLTALMRRPWPVVARHLKTATEPEVRARAFTTLIKIGPALANRRPIPAWLESQLRMLERWQEQLVHERNH